MKTIEGVPVSYTPNFCYGEVEDLWVSLPFNRVDEVPRTECWMNDYNVPY